MRAARGGVDLGRDEGVSVPSFDPATREPTGIEARGDTEAHRLIERLMVAANEAVAAWLVDRGLPGIFRVHDQPARGPRRDALAVRAWHWASRPASAPS